MCLKSSKVPFPLAKKNPKKQQQSNKKNNPQKNTLKRVKLFALLGTCWCRAVPTHSLINIDNIFAFEMLIHAVIDLHQGFSFNRCQTELPLAV